MAPILSLSKDYLGHIRNSISLSVVSIWQVGFSKCKKYFRSGFVLDCVNDKCIVVSFAKDLEKGEKTFVQFENGQCFEASSTFSNESSKLVAIVLTDLEFEPKKVTFATQNVSQCEEVVHMGNFDEENPKLNFSTGSVGLVGHNPILVDPEKGEDVKVFSHCCSQRLNLIGAPVFNLQCEVVGLNYWQKKKNNLFFSLDLEQSKSELIKLFGGNMEQVVNLITEAETHRAKRKKIK